MPATILNKTTTVKHREYVVGIYLEHKRLLVRKSEIIAGIRVALDETYVLDIDSAIWMQQYWINELHEFSLN